MNYSTSSKKIYHPLVPSLFYLNMLPDEFLKQIPNSTIFDWGNKEHELLYGFEWIKEYCDNFSNFQQIHKHRIIYKSASVCCRIIDSFSLMFSEKKGFKQVLKKNAKIVVDIIDRIKPEIELKRACRIFKITTNQYYSWKNKINCSASVLNLCFRTHPRQLTMGEVDIIEKNINDPKDFFKPLSTIYFELLRKSCLFCCLSTFYKYSNLVGNRIPAHRVIKKYEAFRASRVFEYLHVDTTFIRSSNGMLRVVFVKDNFSKAILNKAVVPDGKSENVRDILLDTFKRFGLSFTEFPVHIISDGGSENSGEVNKWVESLNNRKVIKLTAKKDFPFSNSMEESLNNVFKNEFLRNIEVRDKDHCIELLEKFEDYYNNNRYPIELHGLAPMEVVAGQIPDKNRFRDDILMATNRRYLLNSKYSSEKCYICR